MPNQDKHYTVYLRSAKMSVPCTKQQFDDYYRDINAYRRTQMNHGRCICPKSEWLYCDMDCGRCPHQTAGDMSSLDDGLIDDEGNEMNRLDHLQEKMPELQCTAFADTIAERSEMQAVLARLCEIMPKAVTIGRLREQGSSDTDISKEIGVPRKTFTDQLKKARDILKKEFPELF